MFFFFVNLKKLKKKKKKKKKKRVFLKSLEHTFTRHGFAELFQSSLTRITRHHVISSALALFTVFLRETLYGDAVYSETFTDALTFFIVPWVALDFSDLNVFTINTLYAFNDECVFRWRLPARRGV